MSKSRRKSKSYFPPTPEVIDLKPLNQNQKLMMDSIDRNPITIVNGASGVGKSCVALYKAVQMYEHRMIDKILYIKPNVDFGNIERGVGFLKGDLNEKLMPLAYPVLDNLDVFCSPSKAKSLIDQKKIEVGLLEYLRGRSLQHTFVLADECQNFSPHALLTIITRLGAGSKLVAMGDTMQCDINLSKNALADALIRLRGIDEVGIVQFSREDIVRNGYIGKIIGRYENR